MKSSARRLLASINRRSSGSFGSACPESQRATL
jgi:hypothetical protein